MNADLHCHSTFSDGLLSPTEVVRRAASNGVELLALTDHDELAGLVEAEMQAKALGIHFMNGVEVSVLWNNKVSIHIVGLGVNRDDPALQAGLASIRLGRDQRAIRMAQSLEESGISGALEGAKRYVGGAGILSRTHFARFLVEQGLARDTGAVFKRFLVPGKPGYVEHQWPSLEDGVRWIVEAGGIAVIAHPARYRISAGELRRLCGGFRECGGLAIEVVSGAHSIEHVRTMTTLAKKFDFLASRGSDFHGTEESYADLGRLPPLPEGLRAVWEELV